MSEDWDVLLSDKLRALPLKAVVPLIEMFTCNKLPLEKVDKDVVKTLIDLKVAKVEGKDLLYIKDSITHTDYWDLIDSREQKRERQVKARIAEERKQNG